MMAFHIKMWSTTGSLPSFRFSPEWDPGGPDFEDKTWLLLAEGRRIPPERVPKRGVLKTRHKAFDDVLGFNGGEEWAVSDRVLRVFDRIAPGQVETVPIDLVRRNGQPLNDQHYHFINGLPRLDVIDWDKSNLVVSKEKSPRGFHVVSGPVDPLEPLRIVVSRARRNGAEIWHQIAHASSFAAWVFVSDSLAEALKAEGITGIKYDPISED